LKPHGTPPPRRLPAWRYRRAWLSVPVTVCAVLLVLLAYQAIAPAAGIPADGTAVAAAQEQTAALQLTAVLPGPAGQRATPTATAVPRPAPGVAPAAPVAPGLPADVAQPIDIPTADQQLRQAVTAAMLAASRRAGVAIDASGLVYGSRNDVLVANAAVAGAENITPSDLEAGANLMFVYLRLPTAENRLPAGFYTVSVRAVPGTDTATAQLRNEAGAMVAEVPARTAPLGDEPGARKVKVTLEISDKNITIDIEISSNAAIMVDIALTE
jgi:hypothetical protein